MSRKLVYGGLEWLIKTILWSQRGRVEGLENLPSPPFILAINHQGLYDPFLVVLALLKKRQKKIFFLTQKSLTFFIPSFLKKFFGMIPASFSGLKEARKRLQQGFAVGIFIIPRQKKVKNETRLGAAWLWKKTKRPVIPVAITGIKVAGNPLIFWVRALVSFFQKKKIVIGPAVILDGESDLSEITAIVKQKIEELLIRRILEKD